MDYVWWVTVVDIPVVSALFWFINRTRKELGEDLEQVRGRTEADCARLRETLYAYKLEAAKTYATQAHIRTVEARLTDHLERIEGKLDAGATTKIKDR